MMIKKQYFLLAPAVSGLLSLCSFKEITAVTPKTPYYVIVEKSANTITLYDKDDWVVQWPCTFGNSDLKDKMYEGDRRTPEGSFTILSKYKHAKWHKMMMLDFPTAADKRKFEARKSRGEIPATAKIGGLIGIHGTWAHEDWAVENLQNWTMGCISMRNDHLDELYKMVPPGTVVIIKK